MGKRAVEMSLPLDVRAMQRDGCLRAGAVFSRHWRWQSNGESAGSIGGIAHENSVTLAYKHAGETVTQNVVLEWTRCNYGGCRVWWKCPTCARRVALIYGSGKYFVCRHCYRLCYQSQLEQQPDRWLRAAWEIRRRLGQRDGGHFDRVPDKPKGMHWKTYSRYIRETPYIYIKTHRDIFWKEKLYRYFMPLGFPADKFHLSLKWDKKNRIANVNTML